MLPNIDYMTMQANLLDLMPEMVLILGIVGLLFARLFKGFDNIHLGRLALLIAAVSLLLSVLQWLGAPGLTALVTRLGLSAEAGAGRSVVGLAMSSPPNYSQTMLFGGLLIYDLFTVYLRVFLYLFLLLVIWLSLITGIPDREDSGDFYTLLLGATLGMVLMASSAHLLMVFLAVEMASLPSYALAGFLKGRRQSSEAALKYVVYGGGAAGIMLYGISLLAGKFGTGYLPEVAMGLVASLQPSHDGMPFDPVVILGTLFVLIGIAFKLAAVPFHFWCPDVFEGASAEVAGFLSVASKAAALALLARLTMFFGGLDPLNVIDSNAKIPYDAVIRYLVPTLAFFAAVTATFGNLAAYLQTNLKRLLAYSTIAHAGYMMMALCTLTRTGVEAMLFYLVAYLFMNLGAFAVVAFLRNQARSEDLADFRGLVRRSPVMVVTLSAFLLSLLGIPPLVGFAAKFQVFAALFSDGQAYYKAGEAGLGATLIGLLVVGGLNTVLSAFYYLKVMKVMILDRRAEDLEGTEPARLPEPAGALAFAGLMTAAVLGLGILWGPVGAWSERGVARFRTTPGVEVTRSLPTPEFLQMMGGGGGAPKGGQMGGGGPKGGGPKGGGPKGGGPKGKAKGK
jgi:NADH-quinone oxidoreductase subunit N